MKSMKLDEKIVRVSDMEAFKLEKRGWSYISKNEWKQNVRGNFKESKETTTEVENQKIKKGNPKGKAKKQQK